MKDIARPDIKPAFAERNIPVALATDENYLPYLKVTINSAIASSPGSNLDIIVLHAGIPEDAILDFTARYAGTGNASVRFVDISEELETSGLSDYKQTARLPLSSCYRLLLPRILPAYGKIVYIDVDVAVCRDLGELYATDVGDNWFAAAKDVVYTTKPEYVSWAGKWGFTEWDGYVNTGVLVMNLERFRREPVFDRLKEIVFEAAKWNCAQDALNFVCKGAIAPLDPRWNVQLGDYCISKQIALTGEEMWIAHFTGGEKPWKYPVHRYSHLWWRHVDCSDGFSVVLWRSAFDVADTVVSQGEGIAVSVIVPVYNAETYLVQMLVSLAAQTLRNIEVICVDDGSTDGSCAICERFAAADARFKILHQTNSGAAVARNRGIGEARGRWLFFADADDFCRPDMLADMVAEGKARNADIVVAGSFRFDARQIGECCKVCIPAKYVEKEQPVSCHTDGVNVFSGLGFAPWNKLYKSDFVHACGIRYHQTPPNDDVFFVLATLILARRIALMCKEYYYYRAFLETSQMGQADKHPANFLASLLEVRDIVATQKAIIQQDFFVVAVKSCFDNLMMRKTHEGIVNTYAAIRDGGLEALRLPFADETCADIGICRKAFALTLAKADVLIVLSTYCREQHLSELSSLLTRDVALLKLKGWLAEKTAQYEAADSRIKVLREQSANAGKQAIARNEAHKRDVERLKTDVLKLRGWLAEKTEQYKAADSKIKALNELHSKMLAQKEAYRRDVDNLKGRIAALDSALAKSNRIIAEISKSIG
ncbi:MAG: glycosyltransferase [Kiritimatiellae bacterium]|nr:glycosyltransferase [Kiritimatiellia bacterium]